MDNSKNGYNKAKNTQKMKWTTQNGYIKTCLSLNNKTSFF